MENPKTLVVLDTLLKKPVALPTAPGKHPGKGSLAVKKKKRKEKEKEKGNERNEGQKTDPRLPAATPSSYPAEKTG